MYRFFMIAGVLSLSFGLSTTALAGERQYDMRVDGLTCPFCVATSAKALKKIDGVSDVSVDLDAGIISVCATDGADLSDKRMTKLFRKKGFTFRSQTQLETCRLNQETADKPSEASAFDHKPKDQNHEPHDKPHEHRAGYGS